MKMLSTKNSENTCVRINKVEELVLPVIEIYFQFIIIKSVIEIRIKEQTDGAE